MTTRDQFKAAKKEYDDAMYQALMVRIPVWSVYYYSREEGTFHCVKCFMDEEEVELFKQDVASGNYKSVDLIYEDGSLLVTDQGSGETKYHVRTRKNRVVFYDDEPLLIMEEFLSAAGKRYERATGCRVTSLLGGSCGLLYDDKEWKRVALMSPEKPVGHTVPPPKYMTTPFSKV